MDKNTRNFFYAVMIECLAVMITVAVSFWIQTHYIDPEHNLFLNCLGLAMAAAIAAPFVVILLRIKVQCELLIAIVSMAMSALACALVTINFFTRPIDIAIVIAAAIGLSYFSFRFGTKQAVNIDKFLVKLGLIAELLLIFLGYFGSIMALTLNIITRLLS